MIVLSERQLSTLRALLSGRTVTPDRAGLVETWAEVGDYWVKASLCAEASRTIKELRWTVPHEYESRHLIGALAAMRNDMSAWAETVRRLNGGKE